MVGEGVTISITVENVGTTASVNTTVEVWHGNSRIDTRDLLPLGPGESRTIDVLWSASSIDSPRKNTLTFKVDPGNKVKELNETNNEVNEDITFVQPPQAKLRNLTVTASKASVKESGEVTVTVTLENDGDEGIALTWDVKDGVTPIEARTPVTVPAKGNKTETFTFKLEGKGEHVITVRILEGGEVAKDENGNDLVMTVTIDVEKKGDDGPGFGAVVALLALFVALSVAIARRRRA
jgi:hypothetical protein